MTCMADSQHKLQAVLLEILKDMDAVLRENGVPYYLGGGCALGAMRHKGFIPWDDDADVSIMVENREAMEKAFDQLDKEKYIIQKPLTGMYGRDYYKVCRRGTTHITSYRVDREQRISVEVFMIYPVPDGKLARGLHHTMMECFMAITMLTESHLPKPLARMFICSLRGLSAVLNIMSERSSGKITEPRDEYFRRDMLPRDIYGTPTLRDFEDTQLYFPEKIDYYLTQFYGDYMKLPPEDKRVPRNHKGLSFDVDYCDYPNKPWK